ncbi:MAPEG family protein [Phenylobacterium sp.]|uniref:MAPEG family protein n=1 Tax=Phenylobacterium sp. TaxID=1871053 RepID=UPI0025EEA583|nr:MAPEG family protein [Phenylobacterium sp.]MBX3482165.1 MAPEG family protein [Phenylobacterium sp.]
MPQELIFAPMGALALLTFLVLGLIPVRRFRAAFAGRVTRDDFRFGESPAVPGDVSIPNRNLMNLLELPVLFYVAGLMYFVAGRLDQAALVLAWAYVALRVVHSAVHLTYNNVLHRLIVYAVSNGVLMAFWLLFFA